MIHTLDQKISMVEELKKKLEDELNSTNPVIWEVEHISWIIDILIKEIDYEKQEVNSLGELTMDNIKNRIEVLLNHDDLWDYRTDFRKAIILAVRLWDNNLIDYVYNKVINYHFKWDYNEYAWKLALESWKINLVKKAIENLLLSKELYNDALLLAKAISEEYFEEIMDRIKKWDILSSDRIIQGIEYKTKEWTVYQVDKDWFLFQNWKCITDWDWNLFNYLWLLDSNINNEEVSGYFKYRFHGEWKNTSIIENVKFEDIKLVDLKSNKFIVWVNDIMWKVIITNELKG